MAKKNETIPFRIFILDTSTGITHKWDDLTEEQREDYKKRMSENAGRVMSRYYSEHPEQYERLCSNVNG